MKNTVKLLIILAFLFLTACVSGQDKTTSTNAFIANDSVNLEKDAMEKLFAIIVKNNKNAELKDNQIFLGNKKIKVSVITEFDESNQGKYVFAGKFVTEIIDSKENSFSVGSIGIGEDRKDAVTTFIDEWIGLFGTAFSDMLANSNSIKVENYQIFSGLMGIRGEKPTNGWVNGSSEMNKKIISALLPIIKKSNKDLNATNLMITVSEKGEIDGECRLNNEVSQEVINELKKLKWDKGSSIYMFKQFYIINKVEK